MNKKEIVKTIIEKMVANQKEALSSHEEYKKAAQDAPGPMQSHSDTTQFQMNTLAENIKQQISLIDKIIDCLENTSYQKFKTIQMGALARVEENKNIFYFYMVPEGAGGLAFENEETVVQTIAAECPLGKLLLSKKDGETVELEVPSGTRKITILSVE